MECKFCNQPLNEDSTLCPHCGKDNAEEIQAEEIPTIVDPAVEEPQPAEIKPGFQMTTGKLTAIIVATAVLVAVLVALVFWGMGGKLSAAEGTEGDVVPAETAEAAVESVPPATIPADGNPDNVTCKGSYSVSDAEILNLRDTVVATAGDTELTNGELQVYYWLQVQQFLSEYGAYASYFGLDYTQPLDTQLCSMADESMTWQQYFLDSALLTWQNYLSLSNESLEKGFEIDPMIAQELEVLEDNLAADAELNGFDSAESWLHYNVGVGTTIEDYRNYLKLYYQGYAYFEELYAQYEPTQEELETYFTEHEEGYSQSSITKDAGDFVDVRHVLIMPEGATSANIRTETFSDEAWAWAENRANELLNEWKSGEANETTFAEMANTHSSDGDGVSGGLYTQVTKGQMVEAFENWCFDESRQYGDVDIVKTEFGYHIMFFVNRIPQWQYYVESDLIGEKVSEAVVAATEKYPLEVDYASIALAVLNMG